MNNTIVVLLLIFSSTVFAQEQALEKCKWSISNENMVLEAVHADNSALSEQLVGCASLYKYFQSLISQSNIRKSTNVGILLGAAQEYSSALRVLWILDQYRDEYVNTSKTAKYGQILDLFENSMKVYFEKLNSLNEKHLLALTSNNPQDVLNWQYLGQVYQDQVNLAASEWIVIGYKNEIYQLAAMAELKK